jgi:hypothetical protein
MGLLRVLKLMMDEEELGARDQTRQHEKVIIEGSET